MDYDPDNPDDSDANLKAMAAALRQPAKPSGMPAPIQEPTSSAVQTQMQRPEESKGGHSTGLGAALGGLGDISSRIRKGSGEGMVQKELGSVMGGGGSGAADAAGATDMSTAGAADAAGAGGAADALPLLALAAHGGHEPEGQLTLVGEKGPELMMPGSHGADVIPLNDTGPFTRQELEAMLGRETLPEESKILTDEMARAMALRKPSDIHHTTGLGAALGGLGDVVSAGQEAYQHHQILGKQKDLVERQKQADRANAAALLRSRYGTQEPSEPGDYPTFGTMGGRS